jgi:hypothetical protein
MGELSYMLSSLVIFSHMIAKSTEYVMPRMMALMRGFAEVYAMRKRGVFVKPMSVHEEQAMLEPHEGCFAEYLFLMTQLGFVTLFAPAFPIAAQHAAAALRWRSGHWLVAKGTSHPGRHEHLHEHGAHRCHHDDFQRGAADKFPRPSDHP